ncbi:16S rRNA (guanine(527)-N(7))-methyltransferase RsmG [Sandaracinobacteroides sayramensis]|uniref:16S rRNA (guanine(527)-N(7))-methyltransferase RsmG n=1 Tax=Sandaracinobacteroides sayramensis TaxID=2913411 RepID=UPI001EDB3739|nr:16S rRNA (guanine(527)-N(7))-methyltransferase RsmG [Sandaracinobacteroides sayramensis]
MRPEEFQAEFDVPRGTMDKLARYAELLVEWQEKMNLVGPATLTDIWGRHFADSAQLVRHVPQGQSWLDIGAGGGFPGMVLAAMGWGRFTLVDSIAKKTRFLEAVRDELNLRENISIVCGRVEKLPTLGVQVATARAAASLDQLFDWAIRHVRPGGLFVFPKGRRWAEEVEEAERRFLFDLETRDSLTDPEARILLVRNLKRL